MQRQREKDRLLKLAVCSKICSAMQFITCPSETRGYWLTERRNMSESWSWNVLSPPHTLVLRSSEFYSQLWLLMRIWLKGTEQFKKKWYCENSRLVVLAVLTPPSPFTSWEFPPRSWCSPPFPAGGWRACPILRVPISEPARLRFQARLSSHLLPGWSTASPGSGPCHLGTATLVCPRLGSWGSPGSPHTWNGQMSLNARGWVCAAGSAKSYNILLGFGYK